jgi:hypothetical protein
LHVLARDARLGSRASDGAQIDAEFAACGAETGTGGALVAGTTAASGAAAVVAMRATIVPFETRSPTLSKTSEIVPASLAGTSIEAFSLSSVTSAVSRSTRSPGFTSTSITGISLKSPMSGTTRSRVCNVAAAGADSTAAFAAPLVGAALATAPLDADASVNTIDPSLTVSPTFTAMLSTTPACDEGTSIVAFSDSSAISGSSTFTVSPGFTRTSMMGTSWKSPMLGTRTSIVLATLD